MNESAEKKDRTEYFQHYYETRKDELSKRRHDLYHSDMQYREKAKDLARRYRARKKEERERLRREGKLPPPKPRGQRKAVAVVINGVQQEAYTVKVVAKKINRSVNTINYWKRAGLLPSTPLKTKGGISLYTYGMIMVIQMALSRRGEVSHSDHLFYQEIVDGWEEIGVSMVDRS